MNHNLLSIGEAARMLGVSIDTLRRWDKAKRLISIRTGSQGHRYYSREDLSLFLGNVESQAQKWAGATDAATPDDSLYCPTRDIFQARLEKLQSNLTKNFSIAMASLVIAVAGEIGNNSFDHNLGNWPDIPGIFFSFSARESEIVLADRGQGILATLKRVKSKLNDPGQALKVAFTQTISGRLPEARGNGLKFVRSVITGNPFTLFFSTGDACLNLKQHDKDVIIKKAQKPIRGCLATIGFEGKI